MTQRAPGSEQQWALIAITRRWARTPFGHEGSSAAVLDLHLIAGCATLPLLAALLRLASSADHDRHLRVVVAPRA